VERSVDVGQAKCPGLLLVRFSWDDGSKNSDAVGPCDLAAPICLEMWSGLKSPLERFAFRWR
jgi:hypothetical protein